MRKLNVEIASLFENEDKAGVMAKLLGCDVGAATADELLECGFFLRDRGWSNEALISFNQSILLYPEYIASYYESAFIHRINGRHIQAARVLLAGNKKKPHDQRVENFLLHMLHTVGANSKVMEIIQSDNRLSKVLTPEQLTLSEFGDFLRNFPYAASTLMHDSIVEKNIYYDTAAVYEHIIDSIDNKKAFSLIRLGDGEGCCIKISYDDEIRYKKLYEAARNELEAMWFGREFDTIESGFRELLLDFPKIIINSDVVGIPYQSWIEHEYKISSLRGVPTLVNILRFVRELKGPRTFCSQQIHMDLHNSGYMEKIIRHAKNISVISCLSELPELLTRRFDLLSVDFYKIPGEKGSTAALGQDAVKGVHFPEAFYEICTRLNQPHDGRLFLVAGGILGKFYSDVIKRNGGVALDIGSLADGWAMKRTRPGMDGSVAL